MTKPIKTPITVDEIMAALRAVEAKCKAESEKKIRYPCGPNGELRTGNAASYDMGHDYGWTEAFEEAYIWLNEIVDAVEKGAKP